MGVWGVGNFENDDAADWVYDLQESEGTALIVSTLSSVDTEEYLEAPTCSMALIAAEVVAALNGKASPNLPEDLKRWVASNQIPVDGNLLSLARSSVNRIRQNSELKELWQETEEYETWLAVLDELLSRLSVA